MKQFNTFKIWIGKKLIDWGFGILLKLDDRDWNPKLQTYPGSIKQFKYLVGSWFVNKGIILETRSLDKQGWPGYENFKYYDKNYYLNKKTKKKNRKDGYNNPDNFFRDWDGQ